MSDNKIKIEVYHHALVHIRSEQERIQHSINACNRYGNKVSADKLVKTLANLFDLEEDCVGLLNEVMKDENNT